MNQITNAFYILSNALLIPVMLLLLISVARVLIECGRVLQEMLSRNQQSLQRRSLEHTLETQGMFECRPSVDDDSDSNLFATIRRLADLGGDLPRISFLVSSLEIRWQRSLDRLRGLVKLGPALGLMGTLIPLGPALVGLAVGDIQTMSNNLVIAFSTTVLGLFVGMVAGYLVNVKKHWYQSDSVLLNFAAERYCVAMPKHLQEQQKLETTESSLLEEEPVNV